MHRAAAASAASLALAEHLGHDGAGGNSASQSVAVVAIGRDDRIVRSEGPHGADGHRFFADIEVQEATNLASAVEPRAFLLEAANEDEIVEDGMRERAVRDRLNDVAHDAVSNVEVSPSGNPSSRAFSKRRMIFPLRVRGRDG